MQALTHFMNEHWYGHSVVYCTCIVKSIRGDSRMDSSLLTEEATLLE